MMMNGAFLLLVFPTISVALNSFYATKVRAFDDKRLSQSEMWSRNNVIKFQCVNQCLKEKHCVSFHFSPSALVCVALRERFEGSNVAAVESLGYQLFQTNRPLAKVGSDCELDVDCASLNNAHCNHGTCGCDVGYGLNRDVCRILTVLVKVGTYCKLDVDCASLNNSHCNQGTCRCDVGYGIYRDVCRNLTECSTFSNKFTLYNSTVIIGYDIRGKGRLSHKSCPVLCSKDAKCQSADFDFLLSICYLNTVTWLESSSSIRVTNSATFDFFQRECRW